jgi:RNA polymerase sigma-70 factor (ECF subfamily)
MASEVKVATMTAGGSAVAASAAVADAIAGSTDALARIIATHHDDMARIAFVICGDPDLAQDAVQTAWQLAWRRLGSLRDASRLRPWLMSIAANEARGLLRSQRRQLTVSIEVNDLGSDRFDPGSGGSIGGFSPDLVVALRRLSPEERQLLALRHVAGFDATEIGQMLGISPSGVRSRLARLLDRLRKELGDD